jgi:hypothetical protein
MANPNRDRIVDSLLATIRAVNGASPYTTSVAHAERRQRAVGDIPTQWMPYVGVVEGSEEYEGRLGLYKVRFPVELLIQVVGAGEDNARQRVNDVWDDIYHALNNVVAPNPDGYTRGGAAYDTVIVGTEPVEIINRDIARLSVRLECLYTRNFQNN